jgi:hypothetical protein
MNTGIAARPTPNSTSVSGSVQPQVEASVSAMTTPATATVATTMPRRSRRRGMRGGSRTATSVATTAATVNGMLRRKIHRHPTLWTSSPPVSGPMARPSDETPVQIPIARPRSSEGNWSRMIASASACMIAAPAPSSTRAATSNSPSLTAPARREPAANAISPAMNTRRCPRRSPRRPATTTRQACASRYALTIHCSSS